VAPIIFEKKIGNNRTDGQIRIKTTTAPRGGTNDISKIHYMVV
jgi:hypothetical protein